ncbi:MAG: outer membrane lipoprotein chaperone LolA [Gammaproteobacteria bacterium]
MAGRAVERVLCVVVLVCLTPGVNAAAPQPGSEQLTEFLTSVETMSARFSQTLLDDDLAVVEVSAGDFAISRPGRFRWDYTEPYEQLILADGDRLWIYDAELEQASVRTVDAVLATTPAMLLSGDTDISAGYEIVDRGLEDDVMWAELTPRTDEAEFVRLRLGFMDGEIRVMELFDRLGQTTRVEFFDVVRNPVLGDELFNFSPPDGVDVIGFDGS